MGVKIPLGHVAGKDGALIPSRHAGKLVRSSQSPIRQAVVSGKATVNREYTIARPDGNAISIIVSTSPIGNKQKKTIATASIIADITAQKELEQRKDDFINMTSHELKTPLTSVKVFAQVLQRKLRSKNDKELLVLADRILTQINKLTFLVGDLLDVTRMEKGKLSIVKEKFLVRELAEEVVDDMQPISSHTLVLDWKTKLPVYGDKERIRQVLTNLVMNAIKYSAEEEKIIIGSRKKGNMLGVFVQDFGIGIPEEERKRIFDRFYQVGEDSTYPGLGLGLYISSQIIKQHKGKLWVESKKGKGSTFWFSLPIYKK